MQDCDRISMVYVEPEFYRTAAPSASALRVHDVPSSNATSATCMAVYVDLQR